MQYRTAMPIAGLMVGICLSIIDVRAEEQRSGSGAASATSTPALRPAAKSHIMLAPDELNWQEGPAALPAGAKLAVIEGDPKVAGALFTFRLKFPANYRVMPHYHATDEHLTVISGEFDMWVGDKHDSAALKTLPAGSFMVMPAGTHHFATARTETVVQIHAMGPWIFTYVNPADDPRKQVGK